jgi:hypothetical protein
MNMPSKRFAALAVAFAFFAAPIDASAAAKAKPKTKASVVRKKTKPPRQKVAIVRAKPVTATTVARGTTGTERFTLSLLQYQWDRGENPTLQVGWNSVGPALEALDVVATNLVGAPTVRVRTRPNEVIVIAGLNPFVNYTVDATPLWSGLGKGATVRISVAAGAKGPRPEITRPEGLKGLRLTGERPNPCVAMRWKYNPARQQFDALGLVTESMNSLAQATGIEIIYDGLTDEYDNSGGEYSVDTVDVDHPRTFMLVQWEDPLRPATGDSDTTDKVVLGIGSAGFRRGRPGFPEEFADGGSVTLRASKALTDATTFRSTMLHELGHVVGLDHVDDQSSIMYPLNGGVTEWTPSDLAALATVGRPGAGRCFL